MSARTPQQAVSGTREPFSLTRDEIKPPAPSPAPHPGGPEPALRGPAGGAGPPPPPLSTRPASRPAGVLEPRCQSGQRGRQRWPSLAQKGSAGPTAVQGRAGAGRRIQQARGSPGRRESLVSPRPAGPARYRPARGGAAAGYEQPRQQLQGAKAACRGELQRRKGDPQRGASSQPPGQPGREWARGCTRRPFSSPEALPTGSGDTPLLREADPPPHARGTAPAPAAPLTLPSPLPAAAREKGRPSRAAPRGPLGNVVGSRP